MPQEPAVKDASVFVDGQNLFKAAREAFGHTYPNYDVLCLAHAVCAQHGWRVKQVSFYTGVPAAADRPDWHHFWEAKLLAMTRQGVRVFSRPLRYAERRFQLPDGTEHAVRVPTEKGVDVRIALDIVRAVYHAECSVVLVFSQDQDLSEAADEVRLIARDQRRWVRISSAFPFSPTTCNRRGVNKTDWLKIDRATYDACLDPRDYRPGKQIP